MHTRMHKLFNTNTQYTRKKAHFIYLPTPSILQVHSALQGKNNSILHCQILAKSPQTHAIKYSEPIYPSSLHWCSTRKRVVVQGAEKYVWLNKINKIKLKK